MDSLTPLSRGEFMAHIGILHEIDPLIEDAYRFCAEQTAGESDIGHGRKDKWHVSFHGSSFPGDNPVACPRKSLYRMLDFPRQGFPRQAQQFMDQGKDFETQVVRRLHDAGMLVSAPPWETQTGFEKPEYWLTTSLDAIVLPTRSMLPRVAEIKLIYDKSIKAMLERFQTPYSHNEYVRQTRCAIGLAHEAGRIKVLRCHNTGRLAIGSTLLDSGEVVRFSEMICPKHRHSRCLIEVELWPVRHGWLYYANRNDTTQHREFYFEHDSEFMRKGYEKLKLWREWFETGVLPQTEFDEKKFSHPFAWLWSKPEFPCKYCDFGEICRDDHRAAVKLKKPINLADSAGIDMIRAAKPDFDYLAMRKEVFERWGLTDPLQADEEEAA